MKRLFIAVPVNPGYDYLGKLVLLRNDLRRERIKWVEPHNIHLTLKFLGETVERRIPVIQDSLTTLSGRSFSMIIRLEGSGIFGSRYQPRVLWAGIRPFEPLQKLMAAVHAILETEGFPRDRQNLVPHLTLGRIKEIQDMKHFQDTVKAFGTTCSPEFMLDRIILFESILMKTGPHYIPLSTWILKNPPEVIPEG